MDKSEDWIQRCLQTIAMKNESAAAWAEAERAFAELVRACNVGLRHFLRRCVRSSTVIDIAATEALLQIWEKPEGFEGKAKFQTYLYGIARYKAIDELRKDSARDSKTESLDRYPQDHFAAANPEITDEIYQDQRFRAMQFCFSSLHASGRLSEEHLQVLHLSYIDGLGVTEIADLLGIPSGTVKSRLHHARNTVKQCLERKLGKTSADD